MTGLKFSGLIVPDTDDQATGGMLASGAHSTGRQTKYRAALNSVKAVAGRREIPGNANNLSGRGVLRFIRRCTRDYLASWCAARISGCIDTLRP